MTTKSKSFFCKRFFTRALIFLFLLTAPAVLSASDWIVAAQKFDYSRGQTKNAVTDAMAEMFPVRILEKLSQNISREVMPDEQLERLRYNSKKDRLSLFLQLSAAYKKRDALILGDYSPKELKKKIAEEEKNIKTIQDKIDANLEELKTAEENIEENMKKAGIETSDIPGGDDFSKFSSMVKNMFTQEEDLTVTEQIKFYNNDYSNLFKAPSSAAGKAYDDYDFKKAVLAAKINSLVTGTITAYGDYLSMTVDVYLYPEARLIGSVTEAASASEADFLAASIARQLVPVLTNAMPVTLQIQVQPEEAAKNCQVYFDDVLQTDFNGKLMTDSGVHTVQFVSKDFAEVGASYFFKGNTTYSLSVTMKPKKEGVIHVGLLRPEIGQLYAEGELIPKASDGLSHIKINGRNILGEFYNSEKGSVFYYIPENLIEDNKLVTLKPKAFDRDKYIDTSRKLMYVSYSLLVTSLIPFFYTEANYHKAGNLYNSRLGSYQTAKNWEVAYNITAVTSISCGVLFAAGLVHYLYAANSVIPQKAGAGKPLDLEKIKETEEKIKLLEKAPEPEKNVMINKDGDAAPEQKAENPVDSDNPVKADNTESAADTAVNSENN